MVGRGRCAFEHFVRRQYRGMLAWTTVSCIVTMPGASTLFLGSGLLGSRPPGQLRLWNIEGLRVTTSMMSGAGKTKAPAWAFQVVLDGSDGLD